MPFDQNGTKGNSQKVNRDTQSLTFTFFFTFLSELPIFVI